MKSNQLITVMLVTYRRFSNMKNKLSALFVLALGLSLVGCSSQTIDKSTVTRNIINGGFESGDLSGWTIEYGDAFTDDSVSSKKNFYFKDDEKHNLIDINHTGNWYLSGRGFDLKHSHGRVGAIRSTNFYLGEESYISLKLAGGALTKGKGVDAAYKNVQEVCYVGIYLAETDQMIARQTNEYFLEHTEDFVDSSKYANGVYHTDNFCEYMIDLSEYQNKELYIRIVDNDTDVYYGYLSVDDIRIGDALPQAEGQYFVKTRQYVEDVEAEDEYHIKNPGFETGSLAGWTIVEGDAFSHEGVNNESTWWNENITYNRDGFYHYGYFNPSGTGVLRSSVFKLGGKGFVSFKLGGCADQGLTYIRFMEVTDGEPIEITKVSNVQYKNEQFPFVPMKMHLLNMVQYYIDLHEYVNARMYIEIVDNNPSSDDLGSMVFDSFETYYETTPYWEDKEYYRIDMESTYEREPENEFQVKNGTFETGDLSHWVINYNGGAPMGEISSKYYWWDNGSLPFNKKGTYFYSGELYESGTGTLTSTPFTIGGCGYMTFRMSGGRDPLSIYVSILDADTNDELMRFANFMFNDLGTELVGHGSNLMNMIFYKADLTSLLGEEVKIQVVDNATANWGLVCVDSFITYYESEENIDNSAILSPNTLNFQEKASSKQVTNGTFETGDLTGWTASNTEEPILGISRDYTWWNECYLYNKAGSFFLNGWVAGESRTGSLTSSSFLLDGSGYITYRLGGGKNKDKCYIEFLDADDGDKVLETVYNQKFKEISKNYYYQGHPLDLAYEDTFAANMVAYKVNLSAYVGRHIKIRIVDNAVDDWGLLFVDDFITYYSKASDIPSEYVLASLKAKE